MALIDRNFSGFAKELFTDAGKYVIHFGEAQEQAAEHIANTVQAPPPPLLNPPSTHLHGALSDRH